LHAVSKRWAPITQRRGATSQKNGDVIRFHKIERTSTKQTNVFLNATPCILAEMYRHFGEMCFRIDDCSILKMEAICFSETSVDLYQTTRRNISERGNFQ